MKSLLELSKEFTLSNVEEIQLESESGYRGVGISSAEISFYNPDSEVFSLD